ncbi:Hsp20/alpha crystallin family protein (plasmid) [Haladaptatus sp. SPP-AMP-3]|uniref:Hsp20/alpha crystallin family protein n=1 Tax=Haladaptatus sp. SPP-AMP-3 TaxID=3121295 RepID=UPI003C2BAE32
MAGRRNPFDEIEELFERMGRQFETMGDQFGSKGMGWQPGGMSLDVADHDETFVVTADLPGFEKDDIDISLRGDRLRIAAESGAETEEGDEDYLRRERRQQSMSRTLTLPEAVDESSVSAEYQNGVLTVTLPKASGGDESHDIEVN